MMVKFKKKVFFKCIEQNLKKVVQYLLANEVLCTDYM